MNKEQFAEVFELSNRHIGTAGCLKTFDAADANANVGSLYHGDIIGAVPDGEEDSFQVAFNEFDDERFLKG